MKKKILFLFVAVVVFLIVVLVVQWLNARKQGSFGRIKIVSYPSEGVFIDSVAIGKTPYEEKYKVGEFLLKLIPEGDASSTASWQGKVKVYKNSLTYVSRELGSTDLTSTGQILTVTQMDTRPKNGNMGEIYVEVEPTGAIVYLDNDEKGVAPLVMQDVPQGDHELSVSMPGFFKRTEKINVSGGYRVNASFKLAIDQSNKPVDQVLDDARKEATLSATPTGGAKKKVLVTVLDTPTGFLRVRASASLGGAEVAQVKPGEKYELLEESGNGWTKIKLTDKEGWVSGQYVKKEE